MYNKRLSFRVTRSPNPVAMNKYYCAGNTGSDFFEKAREKIENMSDLFQNMSDIFFAKKGSLCFNQLQRSVFHPVLNKIRLPD
jgi:hypothetical protein